MTGLPLNPNRRLHLAEARLTPLRCLLLLLVFLFMQCVSGAQDAQPSSGTPAGEYTLTINANMVLLSATVVDRNNALVGGLDKDDFHIYEDGVLQPIRSFSHEDIPVTAGILVDNSQSMGPKRADVIAAAMAFAKSSNPQDQMFVVNFNDNVFLGLPADTPFTDRPDKLLLALSTIRTIGKTALYDGIALALRHLQQGNREKKILILLTDGGDTASKLTLPQILALARQSSAILYAIGIFDDQDGDQNPGVLNRLTRETGGEAFFPASSKELASICEAIARDIRTQYTLSYVPTTEDKPGSYRAIQVKAGARGHSGLSVRTRAGYTVPAPPPPSAAKAILHDNQR
jgi:VWFA-related protein